LNGFQLGTRTAETYEATFVAAIYLTGFACSTCVVIYNWLNDYTVAFLVFCDAFADGLNNAAEFMAEGQGDGFFGDGMGSCWA
jgi:hypothetical protein